MSVLTSANLMAIATTHNLKAWDFSRVKAFLKLVMEIAPEILPLIIPLFGMDEDGLKAIMDAPGTEVEMEAITAFDWKAMFMLILQILASLKLDPTPAPVDPPSPVA